jgi:menaquinol-cytochrome c reductase iron-sulfur subunit
MQPNGQTDLTTNIETGTEGVERRTILTGAICALSTLIVGGMGSSAAAYLLSDPTKQQEKRNDWTDAGDLPNLHTGTPEQITFERSRTDGWKTRKEKDSAWVVLNDDGTFTAFSPLCTHLGCAYQWSAQERQFSCPCHGSAFSATGAVLSGPAPRPLDRFATKIEGSRLWLGPVQAPQVS